MFIKSGHARYCFSCVVYSRLKAFGKKRDNKTHGKISYSTELSPVIWFGISQSCNIVGGRIHILSVCQGYLWALYLGSYAYNMLIIYIFVIEFTANKVYIYIYIGLVDPAFKRWPTTNIN